MSVTCWMCRDTHWIYLRDGARRLKAPCIECNPRGQKEEQPPTPTEAELEAAGQTSFIEEAP